MKAFREGEYNRMLTREEFILLVIFLVNLSVATIYLLAGTLLVGFVRARKNGKAEILNEQWKAYMLRFVVMALCPVMGLLFFSFSYLLYLTVFRFQVHLEDVIFSKERVRTQLKADEERERSIVSVEEAIVVNDKKSLRRALINIIKGDMYSALSSISLALNSEDSETAHYAASALSDILSEFRIKVHKLYLAMQEEETVQTECEEKLLDFMDGVLRQRIFTGLEQNRFVKMMDAAAETLYGKDVSKMTEGRYENVCLRLLEVNDFENSEKWCKRLLEQYPDHLAAYTCRLKLYFTTKNRDEFFRALNELKKTSIIIDSETLEMIRVFS